MATERRLITLPDGRQLDLLLAGLAGPAVYVGHAKPE